MNPNLTLAPEVGDLAALGAASLDDLLGTGAGLSEEQRAQELASDDGMVLLRCPLPGTPGPGGPPSGRPRGAGTGWVVLRRYRRASLGELLRARFTRPRSDSLASREWNLLCHLRAAGVTTPEPLAVGGEPHPLFSRRSVLVTRELGGMRPAPDWFAREADPTRRRLGLRALGLALARLFRSGADLPRLAAGDLWLADPEGPEGPQGCGEAPLAAGLGWRRLPEVAVASVRGGRLRPRLALPRVVGVLARLDREGGSLAPRERLRVFLLATRRELGRAARRAALARLVARSP